MEELEVQQEIMDKVSNLSFSPPPMKKSDTKDSISSNDSDTSMSFDRRGSKGEEADLSGSESSDGEGGKKSSSKKKMKTSDHDSGADSLDDGVRDDDATTQTTTATTMTTVMATTIEGDEEFTPPSDELAEKICAQVEFYFSDENIVKDAFLLKHVKRNKEGYVSLKLISSFKRVKHLSRDWRVVGAALSRSKKLEVNSLGTKLRRLDPLPVYDQTTPSRTILAARLPVDKLSVETVAEVFGSCGEIALIRVLRPGHPAPAEVRQAIAKRPELATSDECALVEFTDSASARAALQMAMGEMRVYELQQAADKKRKQQPSKKHGVARITREEAYNNSSSCASGSEAEDSRSRHRRPVHGYPIYPMAIYPGQPYQGPPSQESWLSRRLSGCSMSGSESGYLLRRLSSCSGSGSEANFGRRYSSCSSASETGYHHPMYPPGYLPQHRRFSCSSGSGSDCCGGFNPSRRGSGECGPFFRRLSTCSRDSGFDPGSRRVSSCSTASESLFGRSRSNSGPGAAHLPDNITRMPSGPDGTRGFGRPPRMNPMNSMNPMSQVMTAPMEPTC